MELRVLHPDESGAKSAGADSTRRTGRPSNATPLNLEFTTARAACQGKPAADPRLSRVQYEAAAASE